MREVPFAVGALDVHARRQRLVRVRVEDPSFEPNQPTRRLRAIGSNQTQRSEHETGVFLAGLDMVAKDALDVPGMPYEMPPLVCYLQRGQGAAIRRARTRLPGGGENPAAIIKVPRTLADRSADR